MANAFIKAEKIVEMASLILRREIVLPRLVWTDFTKADFQYAKNDTITMRAPAVRTAKTRAMRSSTALVAEDLAETSVDVKLTDHVYDLLKVTDEQLTLDIRDFAKQILNPQMQGVAEGLEDVIADALAAAPVTAAQSLAAASADDPYDKLLTARRILNDFNVPKNQRVLAVGSGVEEWILGSDRVSKAQNSGDATASTALHDATIARVAGFQIVQSNAIDPNAAYAFHKTAIAFAAVAPALPDGAPHKAMVNQDGFGLRYIRDYAPENSTGPVDRTLVDAFTGAASVNDDLADLDADTQVDDLYNRRLVKFTFTP